MEFTVWDVGSAPEGSRSALEAANYTNHIAHTLLDSAFAASACVPAEKRGVGV